MYPTSKVCQSNDLKMMRPTMVDNHLLFNAENVAKHNVMDDKWTIDTVKHNFERMNALLYTTQAYLAKANKHSFQGLTKRYRELRNEVRDGRNNLNTIIYGSSKLKIRRIFENHKELLRLYIQLPVHQVLDSVLQRTFVLKKERDRLYYRLKGLKEVYLHNLQERDKIETRLKYFEENILEEEIKLRTVVKNMQDSEIRLQVIKTINVTYKKMIQILRSDELFYEQVLVALQRDSDEQLAMINYIIEITTPTISELTNLKDDLNEKIFKSRKSTDMMQNFLNSYRKLAHAVPAFAKKKITNELNVMSGRYLRETFSMNNLVLNLQSVESLIRNLQDATVVVTADDIFNSIKYKAKGIRILEKRTSLKAIQMDHYIHKCRNAEMQKNKLLITFWRDSQRQNKKINALQTKIAEEGKRKKELMQYIRQHAKITNCVRVALWNISGILHGVVSNREARIIRRKYPTGYLNLPLLRFDMLVPYTVPPLDFETNLVNVYHTIKEKVVNLMKEYDINFNITDINIQQGSDITLKRYGQNEDTYASITEVPRYSIVPRTSATDDPFYSPDKAYHSVEIPTRAAIKALSSKLVDYHSKLD